MATVVSNNSFKFRESKMADGMVTVTNGSARDWSYRELVAVADTNDKIIIGFVAEVAGIAAGASGKIDTCPGKTVTTSQFTAGSFVVGNVTVYVTPQGDAAAATIKLTSAAGDVPLNARVISYNASTVIELLMPYQDGTAVAAS